MAFSGCRCGVVFPQNTQNTNTLNIGPRGPTGPQGPQGPQGESGVANGVYGAVYNVVVAQNSMIPIILQTISNNSQITIAGFNAILNGGTYQISYGFVGSVGVSSNVSVGLFSNGVQIINEVITNSTDNANVTSASKTIIFNIEETSLLSIYNVSGTPVNFESAYLTVLKLL